MTLFSCISNNERSIQRQKDEHIFCCIYYLPTSSVYLQNTLHKKVQVWTGNLQWQSCLRIDMKVLASLCHHCLFCFSVLWGNRKYRWIIYFQTLNILWFFNFLCLKCYLNWGVHHNEHKKTPPQTLPNYSPII